MKKFHSEARKAGDIWVLQCVEEPKAQSEVADLSDAVAQQRAAIAKVTGLKPTDIKVEIVDADGQSVDVPEFRSWADVRAQLEALDLDEK